MKIHTYLNFDGQSKEAFEFYADVLGAELTVQTFGDTPMEGFTPPSGAEDKVLHARLELAGGDLIMASDHLGEFHPPLVVGNNTHINVHLESRDAADAAFARLKEGGSVFQEMGDMPWGDYYGACTDRFGIQWMVTVSGAQE